MALSFTEAIPWMTSPSQGIKSPGLPPRRRLPASRRSPDDRGWSTEIPVTEFRLTQFLRVHFTPRTPQRFRLCLSTPFRHRSAKFANSTVNQSQRDYGEDEPTGAFALSEQRLEEQDGGQHTPDRDHEHDRIANLVRG